MLDPLVGMFVNTLILRTAVDGAASFESLYSAFSRMHVQRTWDSLLNAPLELDDIVIAEYDQYCTPHAVPVHA